MAAYRIARLDEIPPCRTPEPGEEEWRPVRHHLGIRAFGVNAWVGREAGDWVTEEHVEATDGGSPHEELYFVVRGRAAFTVDGEHVEAGAGTFVFVEDPTVRRGARALEDGTTILAVGAARGIPYELSPWERKYWDD